MGKLEQIRDTLMGAWPGKTFFIYLLENPGKDEKIVVVWNGKEPSWLEVHEGLRNFKNVLPNRSPWIIIAGQ